MGGSKQPRRSEVSFAVAVARAEHLTLREGLGALKKAEGRDRIRAPKGVLGSANIDDDCRRAFPNDSRWDYIVGVQRPREHVAYFIEVHSAETSAVSKMEKKLHWLLGYLRRPHQAALSSLTREIRWVASGRVNIPKHLPQYKKLQTSLREAGLHGPVTELVLA